MKGAWCLLARARRRTGGLAGQALLLAVAGCMLLAPFQALAQTRLFRLSLKPYGISDPADWGRERPDGPDEAARSDGVAWGGEGGLAFDGAGRLYVGLPIWSSKPAHSGGARAGGAKLRVLVIAPDRAAVGHVWEFPTHSLGRLGLGVSPSGAPLVFADDRLMRLGPDGRPTATLAAPRQPGAEGTWGMDLSTAGDTLRLTLGTTRIWFVDPEALHVRQVCNGRGQDHFGSMSGDLELFTEVETVNPLTYGLELSHFCAPKRRLRAFGDTDFTAAMVDTDRFVAVSSQQISLRRLEGSPVWTAPAPANRTFPGLDGAAQVSRDGRRVAVRLLRQIEWRKPESLRSELRDVEAGLGVWAISDGRFLGRISLEPSDRPDPFDPATPFALSPDGGRLAVISEGVLSVWAVK